MPTKQTRKVNSIESGRPPSEVAKTRGWITLSAILTAMKFSGTNAPAVIATALAFTGTRVAWAALLFGMVLAATLMAILGGTPRRRRMTLWAAAGATVLIAGLGAFALAAPRYVEGIPVLERLGSIGLPTVAVQEGGYELESLGELVTATLAGLAAGLRIGG